MGASSEIPGVLQLRVHLPISSVTCAPRALRPSPVRRQLSPLHPARRRSPPSRVLGTGERVQESGEVSCLGLYIYSGWSKRYAAISMTILGSPPRLSRKSKMIASAPFNEAIAAAKVCWHREGSGKESNFR